MTLYSVAHPNRRTELMVPAAKTARIALHRIQVEPIAEPASPGDDTDPQEAAWRTAVEAAPWLVGKPGSTVDAEELYEKLKPFEERVASDIEDSRRERRD